MPAQFSDQDVKSVAAILSSLQSNESFNNIKCLQNNSDLTQLVNQMTQQPKTELQRTQVKNITDFEISRMQSVESSILTLAFQE